MSGLLAAVAAPHGIIAWLNAGRVTVLGDHVSVSEVAGFATGAVSVWLTVKLRISNWAWGIANDLLFLILFWAAGLYANAGLQVVYVILGGAGWWAWLPRRRAATVARDERTPVRSTTAREWAALAAAGVAGTAGLTWLLAATSNSAVPFWDALTTVLSLLATYGQIRKLVESWWLWIAADVIYIPLYATQHLGLTALLYVGFLTMCVFGLRDWRRQARTGTAASRPAEPAAAGVAS